MYLAGTDLSGLSLNAAYETNERERESERAPGATPLFYTIYTTTYPHTDATRRMRNVASCWVFRRTFVSLCVSALQLLAYSLHASLPNDAEMLEKRNPPTQQNSKTVTVSSHWLCERESERERRCNFGNSPSVAKIYFTYW